MGRTLYALQRRLLAGSAMIEPPISLAEYLERLRQQAEAGDAYASIALERWRAWYRDPPKSRREGTS